MDIYFYKVNLKIFLRACVFCMHARLTCRIAGGRITVLENVILLMQWKSVTAREWRMVDCLKFYFLCVLHSYLTITSSYLFYQNDDGLIIWTLNFDSQERESFSRRIMTNLILYFLLLCVNVRLKINILKNKFPSVTKRFQELFNKIFVIND